MTRGLKRYQNTGDLHFVTFSCAGRKPYLGSPIARDLFEESLDRARIKYRFAITGYVVMPEHVHLLVSEPSEEPLATALKSLKLSVSKQSRERPFWQPRYYDFNVYTEHKRIEKLRYMHRNPVRRGLVEKPEAWAWSSFRHYSIGEESRLEIASRYPTPT